MLRVTFKAHPDLKVLVVQVSGDLDNGDHFTGFAKVDLTDGDWDARFTGPAGKK